MGIKPPALATIPALEEVLAAAQFHGARALVYAPDAIGRMFLEARPEMLRRLTAASDVAVPLRAMLPAKTPVCFASMFSGAQPEQHGIRKYERPVLACDTLFDALARAGKKAAIVAVRGSSMDIIFRNRSTDYFTEAYDEGVTARTTELLERGEHEFIVAYHQEYDDALHRTAPDSPDALAAARRHVESYTKLCRAVEERWPGFNRVVVFAPDHGAHFDAAKGTGDHGIDIPDDVDVLHFWRVRPGRGLD